MDYLLNRPVSRPAPDGIDQFFDPRGPPPAPDGIEDDDYTWGFWKLPKTKIALLFLTTIFVSGAEGFGAGILPFAGLRSILIQKSMVWAFGAPAIVALALMLFRYSIPRLDVFSEEEEQTQTYASRVSLTFPELKVATFWTQIGGLQHICGVVMNLIVGNALVRNRCICGISCASAIVSLILSISIVVRAKKTVDDVINQKRRICLKDLQRTVRLHQMFLLIPTAIGILSSISSPLAGYYTFEDSDRAESSSDFTTRKNEFLATRLFPAIVNLFLVAKDLAQVGRIGLNWVEQMGVTDIERRIRRETFWLWVTKNGFKDAVAQLLASDKVDPSTVATTDGRGQTALHLAALYGHEGAVGLLLASDKLDPSTVATTDGRGQTALHLAALYGHEGVVGLLLASDKMDPSTVATTDGRGQTALHLAARYGHKGVVGLLSEKNPTGGSFRKGGKGPADAAAATSTTICAT